MGSGTGFNYAIEMLQRFIGDGAEDFHPCPFPLAEGIYGAMSKKSGAFIFFDEEGNAYYRDKSDQLIKTRSIQEDVKMLHDLSYRW